VDKSRPHLLDVSDNQGPRAKAKGAEAELARTCPAARWECRVCLPWPHLPGGILLLEHVLQRTTGPDWANRLPAM
jgi:hypothetical protein